VAAVCFYISGHGFGHASRQIEVMNALGALAPDVRIVVRTEAARWLFDRTLRVPVTFVSGATDTGVVQVDSLHLDESATIARAAEFSRRLPELASEEARHLRAHDARLVVADAPPLACAAAAAAGIPAVVLANFTWDWIYEEYAGPLAGAPDLLPAVRAAYGEASSGWRLPMGGGFSALPAVRDWPYIARHARHDRDEVRRAFSLPLAAPLALASFGGYGLRRLDPAALDCLDDYAVVFTDRDAAAGATRGVHVVEERRLYDAGLRYEDLVRAVDAVVSKPGYGIISECLANDTALVYTSRGRFREYDVMVAEMPRVLRCAVLEQEALLAGRWKAALDEAIAQPGPPERPATDGADRAAREIVALIG
jgi:L-arabinokinase